MQEERVVMSILVENNAGVLARVAGLFGRRGYNIDSLTVSETNDRGISRITISTHGDSSVIRQIMLQTGKLYEIKTVHLHEDGTSIHRELLLVKVAATEKERHMLREICDIYKASIVDLSSASVVVELTGKPQKIDGFLDVIQNYDILELCRTGVTAIDRGSEIVHYAKDANTLDYRAWMHA